MRVQTDTERDAVWRRRVGRLKRRAWKRRLLNGFIVWQIFAVAVWLLPAQWPVVHAALPADGSGPVRAYMTTTGFMQGWGMYAPNPDTRDLGISVRITYKDGSRRVWTMPRVKDMGYAERYQEERRRKWVEVASNNALLWYPMARYAVHQYAIDPHNPPRSALVIEHFQITPPLGKPALPPRTAALGLAVFRPGDLR